MNRIKILEKAYLKARNSAAGLTNFCEESASVRRCEKELEEAEALFREYQVSQSAVGADVMMPCALCGQNCVTVKRWVCNQCANRTAG